MIFHHKHNEKQKIRYACNGILNIWRIMELYKTILFWTEIIWLFNITETNGKPKHWDFSQSKRNGAQELLFWQNYELGDLELNMLTSPSTPQFHLLHDSDIMEIVVYDAEDPVPQNPLQFSDIMEGTSIVGRYIHVMDNVLCYGARSFHFDALSGLQKVVYYQTELYKWDELNLTKNRHICHFAVDPSRILPTTHPKAFEGQIIFCL